MKKRTNDEIQAQVAGLKAEKLTLPEFSGFGDPNHKGIDAQLDILEGKKTMMDFEDYDDEDEDSEYSSREEFEYVQNMAEEAESWLNGEKDENLFG